MYFCIKKKKTDEQDITINRSAAGRESVLYFQLTSCRANQSKQYEYGTEFETNYSGNLDQLQQLYLNVKKEGMMNPDPYTINDLQADLIFAGYTFNFIKQHDMVDQSIDVVLRFLPPVNGQPNEIIGASRIIHNAKRK